MEEDTVQDIVKLGGNIELSGFSGIDGGTMIILKKIIGNHVKKMSNQVKNLEKISMTMKLVHDNQFELKAMLLDNGKPINSSATERNIFVAVDSALKKIMSEISK